MLDNIKYVTDKLKNEFKTYSTYFEEYFKKIFNKSNKYIKIILYPNIKGIYSIFELVVSDDKNDQLVEIKENIDHNKELLTRFMINKNTDMFYSKYEQNL